MFKYFLRSVFIIVSFIVSQSLSAKPIRISFKQHDSAIRYYHSTITLHFIKNYLIPIMFKGHLKTPKRLEILESFMKTDHYESFLEFEEWIKEWTKNLPETENMIHEDFIITVRTALNFLERDDYVERRKRLSPSMLHLQKTPSLQILTTDVLTHDLENISSLFTKGDNETIKQLAHQVNSLLMNTQFFSNSSNYNDLWGSLYKYAHKLNPKQNLYLRMRLILKLLGSLFTPKFSSYVMTELYYLESDHENILSLSQIKTLYSEILSTLYVGEDIFRVIELNPMEKRKLKELCDEYNAKNDESELYITRRLNTIRDLDSGMSQQAVANKLGIEETIINQWLQIYLKGGLKELMIQGRREAAESSLPELNEKQWQELYDVTQDQHIQKHLDAIKYLLQGALKKEVSHRLGLSINRLNTLISIYREEGLSGVLNLKKEKTFTLSELDDQEWEKLYTANKNKHIRKRFNAIKLLRDRVPHSEIIATLGIYEESLFQWSYHYFEGGLMGLLQLNSHKNK